MLHEESDNNFNPLDNGFTSRSALAAQDLPQYRWERPLSGPNLLIFDARNGSEDRQCIAWCRSTDVAEKIVRALNQHAAIDRAIRKTFGS